MSKKEAKLKDEGKKEALTEQESAQIRARARAEAELKVRKEEEQRKAEEATIRQKEEERLQQDAASLGVKASKVSVAGSRVKDTALESAKQHGNVINRIQNRVEKKKEDEKLTTRQKRLRLLRARLQPGSRCTIEEKRQARLEIQAIKSRLPREEGGWFEPYRDEEGKMHCWRAPRRKSNYERIMGI